MQLPVKPVEYWFFTIGQVQAAHFGGWARGDVGVGY
jgi:hypothetical protein